MSEPHPPDPAHLIEAADKQPGDARLARAFERLYGEHPLPAADEKTWALLQPHATAIARRRRALHGVTEWLASLGWTKRMALGVAAATLLVVPWAVSGALRPSTDRLPRFEVTASEPRPTKLSLLSGAQLALDHGAAKIDQSEPEHTRVSLLDGRLTSQVPHLGPGGAFQVDTEDCEVIVHGTRFHVEKLPGETRVQVDEGLVEVRPRIGSAPPSFLPAHTELRVPGRARYLAELKQRIDTYVAKGSCDAPRAELEEFLGVVQPPIDPSGAEYLLGLCAAHRGETAPAIALFEKAAAHAVDPMRAENALARAAQLSKDVGDTEASAAWQRYLVRFPNGLHHAFAEQELKRIRGVHR